MLQARMPSAVAVVIAVVATVAPLSADAARTYRQDAVPAVDGCQPALPTFDGNIRKRPLAMQNEGSTGAFITCGARGAYGLGAPSIRVVALGLINLGPSAVTMRCTLVDDYSGEAIYLPATVTVPAGERSSLGWGSYNAPATYGAPAISCHLPPGTGITSVIRGYEEEMDPFLPSARQR
jgi:hypothetical protein